MKLYWVWLILIIGLGMAAACQSAPVEQMVTPTIVAEVTSQIEATAIEPMSVTAILTQTPVATETPTATAVQVLPFQTAELTLSIPTMTPSAIPTPTHLEIFTHQLVVTNGSTIVWLGEDHEPWILESDVSKGFVSLSPDGRFLVYVTNPLSWSSHMVIESLDRDEPIKVEFDPDEFVMDPDW